MVGGELNANLEEPDGDWIEEEIEVALTEGALEDMSSHLLP